MHPQCLALNFSFSYNGALRSWRSVIQSESSQPLN